jgi:hypothetical protein
MIHLSIPKNGVYPIINWLVVLTPLKKYEFVNGKDDPILYMKWKIKHV